MKKLLFLLLLCTSVCTAQQRASDFTASGPITANGADCNTTNACISLHMPASNVGYSIAVSGSWTGTLTIEQSANNQTTWSSVTTTTSNTLYSSALTPGITDVRVRGSAAMTGTAQITISASGPATLNNITQTGGNSATSSGPVINVTNPAYGGGASSSSADNSTAFAAAVTAALATYTVGTGTPTVKTSAVNSTASGTSVTTNVTIAVGDVVIVGCTGGTTGRTWTVTDSASNPYGQITPDVVNGSNGLLRLFAGAVGPGGTKTAATSVTCTESGGAQPFGTIVLVMNNVGLIRPFIGLTPGTTTTPAETVTTSVPTVIVASFFDWFNSATIAASQNTGILQQTYTATASVSGAALVTQAQATAGTSTTNNITLGSTSPYAAVGVELLGITNSLPTLYFPSGQYNYSSGLNLTSAITMKCEPGAILNYTGVAHAVDLGGASIVFQTAPQPYFIDGCWFTGGANMTQGIFMQPNTEYVGIRNCTFWNFGNGTAYDVAGSHDNWDVEIGPQNRFMTDDFVPRNFVNMALTGGNNNSYLRFHDNNAFCLAGRTNTGCNNLQAGIGIVTHGDNNRVYHNNIAFLKTLIKISCDVGVNCEGNQIDQNQLEQANTSTADAPMIQIGDEGGAGGQAGLLITQNTFRMHPFGTNGPIQQTGASTTVSGARINFNTFTNITLSMPLVAQNNVTGQGGNISFSNNCSTVVTTVIPCAFIHTTGGNIASWNGDYWLTCTMASGTCTATFQTTYSTAPRCTATWNGTGTLTTGATIKAVPSTTNVVVTSSTGTDTAVVNLQCSSGDGQ